MFESIRTDYENQVTEAKRDDPVWQKVGHLIRMVEKLNTLFEAALDVSGCTAIVVQGVPVGPGEAIKWADEQAGEKGRG